MKRLLLVVIALVVSQAGRSAGQAPVPQAAEEPPVGFGGAAVESTDSGDWLVGQQQLEQKVGGVEQQLAEQQAETRQNRQGLERLRQDQQRLREQLALVEEARKARVAALADADRLMGEAQDRAAAGDAEVSGSISEAEGRLAVAASSAAHFGDTQTSALTDMSAQQLAEARHQLAEADLYRVRVALGWARIAARSARELTQTWALPLPAPAR